MTRKKRCPICREYFTKRRSLQVVCSYQCSITYAERKREKQWRKEKRIWKEQNKSYNDLVADAQKAFNAFIRERDRDKPCISCGNYSEQRFGGAYDAGHFRSVGAAPHLRFNEDNCHKQCVHCNKYLSGNYSEYRKRLEIKIGVERLQKLEADNSPSNLTRDDLRDIKKKYKEKLKALREQRRRDEW